MTEIKGGLLIDGKVRQDVISNIEHGLLDLKKIKAIIIHQTDSYNASGTISGWKNSKGNARVGAHFLVDRGGDEFPESIEDPPKSGKGKYTGKTRAYTGIEGKIYQTAHLNQICWHAGRLRDKKYPNNYNSIGIEFVGKYDYATQSYPLSSVGQLQSGAWLVKVLLELITTIPSMEAVYAHGVIAFKTPDMTEGGSTLEKIKEGVKPEEIKIESSCPEIIRQLFPYLCSQPSILSPKKNP
ncbi:MAG: peptidoglycan recognition protein family protein [Pyrinomonadaceae bacterium]